MEKIVKKYGKRERFLEPGGGEKITEQAGYVPPKIQIENMIMAGQRLNAARAEMYDFPPGEEVDENYSDPTRDPGFDVADASQMLSNLEEKKRESDKNLEKEKKSVDKSPKVRDNVSMEAESDDKEGDV